MGNIRSNLTSIWDTQNETSQNVSHPSASNPTVTTDPSNIETASGSDNKTIVVNDTKDTISTMNEPYVAPTTNLTTLPIHKPRRTRDLQWIPLEHIAMPELTSDYSDPICINGRDFLIVSIQEDFHMPPQEAFIHLHLYNSILNKWTKLQNYRNNKPVTIRARGTKCVYSGDILNEVFADSTLETVSYIERRRRGQLHVLTWDRIIRFVFPPNLQSNTANIRYYIETHRLSNPRTFILKHCLHAISSQFEYFGISDSTTVHLKNGTTEMHRFCAPIGSKALVHCPLIKCVLMFCCDTSIYSYSQENDKWSKLSICCPYDFSQASFAVSSDKRYILIVRRHYFAGRIYIFDSACLQFKISNIKLPVNSVIKVKLQFKISNKGPVVMEEVNSGLVSIGVTSLPDTVQTVSQVVSKWSRRYKTKIPDVIILCICKYCPFNFLHLMASGNSMDGARIMHWKMSISNVI